MELYTYINEFKTGYQPRTDSRNYNVVPQLHTTYRPVGYCSYVVSVVIVGIQSVRLKITAAYKHQGSPKFYVKYKNGRNVFV
jgi:hypothetical protein